MTGPEWRLTGYGYDCSISAVGCSVRELTHGGRNLVVPFRRDQIRPLYRGALIAPWPNRIADGRYQLDGIEQQLPINEVDRGHALHGLVHWALWEPSVITPTGVTLHHILSAQQGYPFSLKMTARFELRADGLTTTLRTTNLSPHTAPYGCCPHPYLTVGEGQVDDWQLTVPASLRVEVDDRLLPVGQAAVEDVGCDFRSGAVIGNRTIDHAFTGLIRDANGDVSVQVLHPEAGYGTGMTWSAWAPWVQIHTADRPEPETHRVGLAVEPMSCPPNAFNDPTLEIGLAPGCTHTASWRIGAV